MQVKFSLITFELKTSPKTQKEKPPKQKTPAAIQNLNLILAQITNKVK